MRKIIVLTLFFVFIFTIQSCGQNPELGENKIDLKTFSVKFNVNGFYKNQIETHKKSLELYSQGKTKDAFSKELLKNYKFVENIDTLSIDKDKYMLMYIMRGMDTKDTLATFGNIRFQKLDMISNEKNEFQSLRATSWTYNDKKNNFNTLKDELQNIHGKPNVIKETFEHGEYYQWTTKDFVVSLTVDKNEERNENMSYSAQLYLTAKSEYENLTDKLIGKTKYYWIY